MNILTVLREIKHALETSNNDDLIVDTLWMAHGRGDETLFDYIDQQIENAEREQQEFDTLQGYAQKDIKAVEQALPEGIVGYARAIDLEHYIQDGKLAHLEIAHPACFREPPAPEYFVPLCIVQPEGFRNTIAQLQRQLDAECADSLEQRRMKAQAREQRDKMTKALMELVRDLAANGGTASPEALTRACEVTKIPMPEKQA